MHERFDTAYGKEKLELVSVPDMVADGAFDQAAKGVSGIVHLASIVTFGTKYEEVVTPTVKGALNIIASASKEPSVRSVVYTSSSAAAYLPEANKKDILTTNTFNDAAVKKAREDPNVDRFTVYAASKAEAEYAIWKAFKETKLSFQIAVILPEPNFGRILQPGR